MDFIGGLIIDHLKDGGI